jgi:hypothetical protein
LNDLNRHLQVKDFIRLMCWFNDGFSSFWMRIEMNSCQKYRYWPSQLFFQRGFRLICQKCHQQ